MLGSRAGTGNTAVTSSGLSFKELQAIATLTLQGFVILFVWVWVASMDLGMKISFRVGDSEYVQRGIITVWREK